MVNPGPSCPEVDDESLGSVMRAWPHLPRAIQEAILSLARAAAGPDAFQTPTFFPWFCSSSHFLSGAK